jgi:hypothetical protein
MALAWLNLQGVDGRALRFTIDTGTNRYYQLRVGRARTNREGFDWVDGVYLTTPITMNDAGGSLLPATREIGVPAARLERGDSYVQLGSYKTPYGRGPAFSRVIDLPAGAQTLGGRSALYRPPLPVAASMSQTLTEAPFRPARRIPCVHAPDQLAHETSLDDLLSGIVKLAAPAVLQMLGGDGGGNQNAASAAASPVTGVVTFLLKTLLSGLTPAAAAPSTQPASAATAHTQSLSPVRGLENRFVAARRTAWSQPFIFGIDGALLATIAGPLLKVLPELVNAANQSRIQAKQADNKLIADALATVNQRMLMEQLLQAQQHSSGSQQSELAQLQQLLQQASAAPAAAPARAQSLSNGRAALVPAAPDAVPSTRAVLTFVTADPVPFDGAPRRLFVRAHDAEFKVRLTVGDPVPAHPLPHAELRMTFKGGHHPADWVTCSAAADNVAANSVLTLTVSQSDLARLPANRTVPVIAELRWAGGGANNAVHLATGSTDIVLVDPYFVRERGGTVGEERELTDMTRFRPFWNKVWEAPALDALRAADGGRRKSLWELDVTARYLVLLTPREHANGVMDTKVKAAPTDADDLRLRVDGRLKGGVELSIQEVNKLCSLWDGQAPLDADRLAALESTPIAHATSGEFITRIRLDGRAGERGVVWVVPVFRMAEFTLGSVQKTDDAGQVVAAGEEKVRFPIPVAARILGLKSQS